jgi:hypothetical protein
MRILGERERERERERESTSDEPQKDASKYHKKSH